MSVWLLVEHVPACRQQCGTRQGDMSYPCWTTHMNISVERIHYMYYTYNYDSTLNHLLTLLCHQIPIHTGLEESVCVIPLGRAGGGACYFHHAKTSQITSVGKRLMKLTGVSEIYFIVNEFLSCYN